MQRFLPFLKCDGTRLHLFQSAQIRKAKYISTVMFRSRADDLQTPDNAQTLVEAVSCRNYFSQRVLYSWMWGLLTKAHVTV